MSPVQRRSDYLKNSNSPGKNLDGQELPMYSGNLVRLVGLREKRGARNTLLGMGVDLAVVCRAHFLLESRESPC